MWEELYEAANCRKDKLIIHNAFRRCSDSKGKKGMIVKMMENKVKKERMEEHTKRDFALVRGENSEIIIIENI